MSRLPRTVALAATLVLALTACGSADTTARGTTSKTTTSTAAPADGETFSTADFSYKAPKGWSGPKQAMPGVVSLAGDPSDKDGFTDNVNVVKVEPAQITAIDSFEKAVVKELEASNASDIKTLPRQQLDGETAVHVTSGASQNGKTYLVNQFAVVHGKANFVITFSFSPDVSFADQESVSQAVVATWHWAS